jgi:hypothetical protein
MRMRRVAPIASAVAFARSERGQRLIADAGRKYDTPENRAKLSEAIGTLRNRSAAGTSRPAR